MPDKLLYVCIHLIAKMLVPSALLHCFASIEIRNHAKFSTMHVKCSSLLAGTGTCKKLIERLKQTLAR